MTIPPVSPAPSISICWGASIASWAAISNCATLSIRRAGTRSSAASKCTLRSRLDQTAFIAEADLTVTFRAGETIWTESSHKFQLLGTRRDGGADRISGRRSVDRSRLAVRGKSLDGSLSAALEFREVSYRIGGNLILDNLNFAHRTRPYAGPARPQRLGKNHGAEDAERSSVSLRRQGAGRRSRHHRLGSHPTSPQHRLRDSGSRALSAFHHRRKCRPGSAIEGLAAGSRRRARG